jgi:hypothetical protein
MEVRRKKQMIKRNLNFMKTGLMLRSKIKKPFRKILKGFSGLL